MGLICKKSPGTVPKDKYSSPYQNSDYLILSARRGSLSTNVSTCKSAFGDLCDFSPHCIYTVSQRKKAQNKTKAHAQRYMGKKGTKRKEETGNRKEKGKGKMKGKGK